MSGVLGHEIRPGDTLQPGGQPGDNAPELAETAAAIQWLRAGLSEETMRLELPPDVRSSISPIITALRWGALLYGLVVASTKAAEEGDLAVVLALSIALFLTVWRTFRPLRLAWTETVDRTQPVVDGVVLGIAAGISGGIDSPFIFCLLVAVAVASFGWGLRSGLFTIAAGLLTLMAAAAVTGGNINLGDVGGVAFLLVMLAVAALVALVRDNLITRQRERLALSSRVEMLTETNEMLGILNQVARTLPESMDMQQAMNATQRELATQFRAETIGLLVRDQATSDWVPMIAEGCDFNESTPTKNLPAPLQSALQGLSAISSEDLEGVFLNPNSGSGLYTALQARGRVVGLLGVETDKPGDYSHRELRVLDGLSDALALTIDNVRSFSRLRTIGADEERTRIARDLHDRLGQWLTYISIELERIMGEVPGNGSLQSLYGDVQTAIDELRETLRQLRTRVSEDETLEVVGAKMADRFSSRTGVPVSFVASNPGASLRVPVENELLRIMQEALNNVEKHAKAGGVHIEWTCDANDGVLTIADNGKGFDPTGSRRDTSYGLIGMRERAEVIGASLSIDSEKGEGTTVTVRASNEMSM